MVKWFLVISTLALLVGGCAQPAAISDIGNDHVKVQGNDYTKPAEIEAEANRGCAMYDKKAMSTGSRVCKGFDGWGNCMAWEYIFACK